MKTHTRSTKAINCQSEAIALGSYDETIPVYMASIIIEEISESDNKKHCDVTPSHIQGDTIDHIPVMTLVVGFNVRRIILLDHHNVSVKSLFIFAILADTLRSIVRSPISTTRPPRISGLIWKKELIYWCCDGMNLFPNTYLGYYLKLFPLAVF